MAIFVDFDLETHNAGKQFSMPPEEFFRLGQYSISDGKKDEPVVLTTDRDEMIEVIRSADYVSGHNISSYDLPVLFGVDSMEPLQMAQDKRVIDTFVMTPVVTRIPIMYTTRAGTKATTYAQGNQKPGLVKKYLSLDNLAHQFGLPGKSEDLYKLAKEHNPKGTLKADLDYGLIPVDDPLFREYAEQDVVAGRALRKYLVGKVHSEGVSGDYVWREILLAAITARISNNGVTVNIEKAQSRIADLLAVRDEVMSWLVEEFDFPTEGKAPWSTDKGKEVILRVLDSFGINETTRPTWPRTPKGALKMGGDELIMLTEGTDAEKFGQAMATLKGQRSLAQLALDSVYEDGLAHPNVTSLQRSGRWSFTEPGLTVWTKNEEKSYIVSAEGKMLVELDYAQADARAMAALSGDPEFAKRFGVDENGNPYDPHNLSGEALFGAELYYEKYDPDTGKPFLRNPAKMGGHSQSYNIGAWKLAIQLNEFCEKHKIDAWFWAPANTKYGQKEIPHKEGEFYTKEMIENFNELFVWLKMFKDKAVEEGKTGWVTNTWGRRMAVDKGREFTQAPALHGQSTTREMMGDALIRLVARGEYYAKAIKAIIHDALLLEFDEATVEKDAQVVKECMEAVFDPKTNVSMPIEFTVEAGHPARNWQDASHG